MAKEHGLETHKGKTVPKEVRSLADRIRKKDPSVSDEYAYRTAWDIFRSHTSEGKSYPHKSEESGLAREGGGTGPIHKKAFWDGFYKEAAVKSDKIPGGKADNHTPGEFNQNDLKKGIKIEMEHTGDPDTAQEISMDHIIEVDKKDSKGKYTSPYYDELDDFEKKVEKKASLYDIWCNLN